MKHLRALGLTALAAVLLAAVVLAQGGCRGCGGQQEHAAAEEVPLDVAAEILRLEDVRSPGGGRLEELAADARPAVRRRAALAMGRIGDARLRAGLEKMLDDPEVEVRREAAFALGLLGESASLPALEARLDDPDPEVRFLAVEAAMRIGGAPTGSAPEGGAAGEQAAALARGVLSSEAEKAALEGVAQENAGIGQGVPRADGETGAEHLAAAVGTSSGEGGGSAEEEGGSGDSKRLERKAAGGDLSHVPPRPADALEAVLLNIWRLTGGKDLLPLVERWARASGSVDPATCQAAAFGLARLGLPESAPVLLELLADSDPRLRALAAKGLGAAAEKAAASGAGEGSGPGVPSAGSGMSEAGTSAVRDAVTGAAAALTGLLARETEWPVRVEALLALGRCGDLAEPLAAERIEAFLAGLADPHPQAQAAACQAAGRLAASGALADGRAGEQGGAEGRRPRERSGIEGRRAVEQQGDEKRQASGPSPEARLRGRLRELSEDAQPSVAADALVALAGLGDDLALEKGLQMSAAGDPRQRSASAPILIRLSNPAIRTSFLTLLGDREGAVTRAALSALGEAGRAGEFQEEVTRLLLEAPAAPTRAAAAEALASAGDAPPFALFAAAFRREREEKEPDVRLILLDILGEHPDEAAAGALVREAFADGERLVRQRAAEILRRWGRGAEIPAGACEAVGTRPPLDRYREAAALAGRRVEATIRTTRGTVRLELLPEDAPLTVLNFLELAGKGYFDGLPFHRLVPGFVVQGGDPLKDGWGGPGYAIRCENSRRRYDRGMAGMALSGKDTGGSQFFVTFTPQPHLDGRYTIFGRVVEGMELLDGLRRGEAMEEVRVIVSER